MHHVLKFAMEWVRFQTWMHPYWDAQLAIVEELENKYVAEIADLAEIRVESIQTDA